VFAGLSLRFPEAGLRQLDAKALAACLWTTHSAICCLPPATSHQLASETSQSRDLCDQQVHPPQRES
jgi:hypothetical protein